MSTTETAFEKKMREIAEEGNNVVTFPSVAKAQPVAGQSAKRSFEKDAPTAEEVGLNLDPEQEALDLAIKSLGIVQAYSMWCRKMTPKYGANQTEGIKVSCPNPQHPDKNPSAWLNSKTNLWYCASCDQGGDIWDMAAWNYGFPVPGYKDPRFFRKLRDFMGADLGFHSVTSITGKTIVITPAQAQAQQEAAPEQEAPATQEAVTPEPTADDPPADKKENSVGKLPGASIQEEDEEDHRLNKLAPTIDWRSLLTEETFLKSYMDSTTRDTCPEEFHFWNGLLALGFALGRDVTLNDTEQVVGNLYVCLTGPSSAGKSRSKRHLSRLLRTAIPYDDSNPLSRGAKEIKQPGSAEYVVHSFQSEEDDPTNPKIKLRYPVRGLVDFDELATLMSTATRVGNAIRPQLMELYDSPEVLESGSLTGGKRKAIMPFGSVVATTQNRSLRKLLDKSDDGSGFLNRWIFAQGQLKPRLHMGGAVIDLTQPSNKLRQVHQWAFASKSLDLSPEADKLWFDFFHSTVVPIQDKTDSAGSAVLARMDLVMKKLFLLFAADNLENTVSARSVSQALSLWPYLVATFGTVSTEMAKTDLSDLQEEVIRHISRLTAANGHGPTRKIIYDCVKRKIKDTKELVELLNTLVKMELVVEVPYKPNVGRPGTRYEVAA